MCVLTKAQAQFITKLLLGAGDYERHGVPYGVRRYNGRAMKILDNLKRLGLVEWDYAKLYLPDTPLDAWLTEKGIREAVGYLLNWATSQNESVDIPTNPVVYHEYGANQGTAFIHQGFVSFGKRYFR